MHDDLRAGGEAGVKFLHGSHNTRGGVQHWNELGRTGEVQENRGINGRDIKTVKVCLESFPKSKDIYSYACDPNFIIPRSTVENLEAHNLFPLTD